MSLADVAGRELGNRIMQAHADRIQKLQGEDRVRFITGLVVTVAGHSAQHIGEPAMRMLLEALALGMKDDVPTEPPTH